MELMKNRKTRKRAETFPIEDIISVLLFYLLIFLSIFESTYIHPTKLHGGEMTQLDMCHH